MWTAGDNFLQLAKSLLDSTYASSFPSTVQSLLLLGYREIGIGAMAQAWAYTGMAVRMAQDLGMHRSADGWARVGMGRLFGERELQERRRIWWGCVVLDGYVSTYIGRPLAIFESDYDTQLPRFEEVRLISSIRYGISQFFGSLTSRRHGRHILHCLQTREDMDIGRGLK